VLNIANGEGIEKMTFIERKFLLRRWEIISSEGYDECRIERQQRCCSDNSVEGSWEQD
jgi:hypothetical protein